MKISAVINTRNEADYIVDCLESLSWVDEIVIVDMDSSDNTKALCYQYTKQVFNHVPMSYVEPARNFGIKHATGDWILILDPDERVSASLSQKLIEIATENKFNFIRLPRKNIIFNEWIKHSRWWPDYNVRFFKRGQVEWQDEIHSIPITYGEGYNLPDEEKFALHHLNYTSLSEYFTRLERYTNVQAETLIKENYQFFWLDLFTKPFNEFLSRYFAGEGYKDGLHGLILSTLQAFSEFIVFLKVWEKQGFEVKKGPKFEFQVLKLLELKRREFNYWLWTLKINQANKKINKLLFKIARKFSL